MAECPHFDRPFRIVNGRNAEVEQDSTDDVMACVLTVVTCPTGERVEEPDFGVPDQVFRQGGVDTDVVAAAIERWEPRAAALVQETGDTMDALARRVTINIRGESNG